MTRSFYLILLLLICGSMSAQNLSFNSNASVHLNSPDSVKVSNNNAGRLDFQFKSALIPVSMVTAGVIIECPFMYIFT
jgi:hypothetical protein